MAHPVASPELCRGSKDISCDCKEYSPPANPGDPAKCQECGHRKSKHPSGSADLSGKDSIKNIFAQVTKRSEKGNNMRVLFYKNKFARAPRSRAPITSLSLFPNTGMPITEANDEVLVGDTTLEVGNPADWLK
jgi:hypothetical protein